MGRAVIVAYTPKPGKEQQLLSAVKKHVSVLRAEHLVTDRPPYLMRAGGGAIVEVFEWQSAEAIERAHANAAVAALWEEFNELCEYTPIAGLEEARQLFAEFETIES